MRQLTCTGRHILVAGGNLHPEDVTGAIAPWADAAEVLAHHTVQTMIVRN
jgi:hypothetical protein